MWLAGSLNLLNEESQVQFFAFNAENIYEFTHIVTPNFGRGESSDYKPTDLCSYLKANKKRDSLFSS